MSLIRDQSSVSISHNVQYLFFFLFMLLCPDTIHPKQRQLIQLYCLGWTNVYDTHNIEQDPTWDFKANEAGNKLQLFGVMASTTWQFDRKRITTRKQIRTTTRVQLFKIFCFNAQDYILSFLLSVNFNKCLCYTLVHTPLQTTFIYALYE